MMHLVDKSPTENILMSDKMIPIKDPGITKIGKHTIAKRTPWKFEKTWTIQPFFPSVTPENHNQKLNDIENDRSSHPSLFVGEFDSRKEFFQGDRNHQENCDDEKGVHCYQKGPF